MKTLEEMLKTARKSHKWTQRELAERMNVSRATISNWENGVAEPDYNTLCRLSQVLQCIFMPQYTANDSDTQPKERKLRLMFTENPVITVNSSGNAVDFTVGTVDFRLNGRDSHGNTVDICISAGISVISDDN